MSSTVPETKATSGAATPSSDWNSDNSIAPTAWQDDICLEPITPVPGFSKLCNACINVFRDDTPVRDPGDKSKKMHVRHIRCSDVLEISAGRGCRLCALLINDIWKQAMYLHSTLPSEVSLIFQKYDFEQHITFRNLRLDTSRYPTTDGNWYLMLGMEVVGELAEDKSTEHGLAAGVLAMEGQSVSESLHVLWLTSIVPHRK